jgi:pimeloyl-ACP methyl ester carboxylesterase
VLRVGYRFVADVTGANGVAATIDLAPSGVCPLRRAGMRAVRLAHTDFVVRGLGATVMDALGLERFDLPGISQGGAVADAARHPGRVNHLNASIALRTPSKVS